MKIWSLILFFLAFGSNLAAQKISTAVKPENPTVGKAFQVEYLFSGLQGNIRPPSFAPLMQLGMGQSEQSINGKTSFLLTYQLLAKQTGTYQIAPIKVFNAQGQLIAQSEPLSIQVGNASNSSAQNTQTNAAQKESSKLFIVLEPNPKEVYEGQPFSLELNLYTTYRSIQPDVLNSPEIPGVWLQESDHFSNAQLQPVNYNGANYFKATLLHWLAIPQLSGKINIPPLKAVFTVQEVLPSQNVFEQLFGGGRVVTEKIEVFTKPSQVQVKPLPEANRPEGFKNAVGDFKFKVEVGPCTLSTTDALRLSMEISGKGNLNLIDFPSLNLPSALESYDPEIQEKLTFGLVQLKGTKRADFVIIPRGGGRFWIPPIRFSWFNPYTESYITSQTDSLLVWVKGKALENSSALNPENSTLLDLPFPAPNDSSGLFPNWFGKPAFWFLFLAPLLGLISWPWLLRPALSRIRRRWIKKTPIQSALAALDSWKKQPQPQAQQLWQIFGHYLDQAFGFPPSKQTDDQLTDWLTQKLDAQQAKRILDWKHAAEWSAFAGGAGLPSAEEQGMLVRKWLLELDKKWTA